MATKRSKARGDVCKMDLNKLNFNLIPSSSRQDIMLAVCLFVHVTGFYHTEVSIKCVLPRSHSMFATRLPHQESYVMVELQVRRL